MSEWLNKIYREEFGGFHPGLDNPIKFKAKIEDGYIWILAVGKWRPIRYYNWKNRIPSQRIQQEAIYSILLNCGFRSAQTIKSKWHVNRNDEMIPVELDWS